MPIPIDDDCYASVVSFLDTRSVMSLQSTCSVINSSLRPIEHWKNTALLKLAEMQASLMTLYLPHMIDWLELLDMKTMSLKQLILLSLGAESREPRFSDLLDCLVFLLDAQHSDTACLSRVRAFLRTNPSGYLFCRASSSSNPNAGHAQANAQAMVGISFENTRCDIVFSSSKDEFGRLFQLFPDALSATEIFYSKLFAAFKESRSLHSLIPRFTRTYNARFCRMSFYSIGESQPQTFTNFAVLIDYLLKRVSPLTPLTPLTPFSLSTHSNSGILGMVSERPDVTTLIMLQAMKQDSVSLMYQVMLSMLSMQTTEYRHTERNGVIWLSCETPFRLWYASIGQPSGVNLLRHRFAQHLGLKTSLTNNTSNFRSELYVGLREEEFESDLNVVELHTHQVPISLVMFYTAAICPNVYKAWISAASGFTPSRIEAYRWFLRKFSLPPLRNIPIGGGKFLTIE